MTPNSPAPRSLREILRGVPAETVTACEEFRRSGESAAFDRAVLGVITHHLSKPPPLPLAELPGTTTLVADLGLDSITMVEMTFLFEDVFNVKLSQEDLMKIVTLDDLRTLLRAQVAARPPGPA